MTIDPTWVHVGRQPQEELVRLFPLVATTNSRYTEKPTTAPVDGYKNNTYSVLNFLSWKSEEMVKPGNMPILKENICPILKLTSP